MSLLGPVVKAAKKLADEWDEAAWLKENPTPKAKSIPKKDRTPEQALELKSWSDKLYYQRNKAKVKAKATEYRAANRDEVNRKGREFRSKPEYKEQRKEYDRRYSQGDKHKETQARYREANAKKVGEINQRYREANREELNAKNREYNASLPSHVKAEKSSARRSAKLQRTPEYSNDESIQKIYEQAGLLSKSSGVPHEVDHVIPLQGENVSGLHVPGNLMITPRDLNRSKSNAFTPGDDPMTFNDQALKNVLAANEKGLLPGLLAGGVGLGAMSQSEESEAGVGLLGGATSLVELILKKFGDDTAGAAKELERLGGFPEPVAQRIATGELPMDEASRVARREAQTDGNVYYHGAEVGGFGTVDPAFVGATNNNSKGTGLWASSEPDVANSFVADIAEMRPDGVIQPLMYKGSSPRSVNANGEDFSFIYVDGVGMMDTDSIARAAKRDGHDSAIIDDVVDFGPYPEAEFPKAQDPSTIISMFDGNKVRSPSAAFDPQYKGPNIMGGAAGTAGLTGLLAAGQSQDSEAGPALALAKGIDLDRLVGAWQKRVSREPEVAPETHLQNIMHDKGFVNYNDWSTHARKQDGGKNGETYFNGLKPMLMDISKHAKVGKDKRLMTGLTKYAKTRFADRKAQGFQQGAAAGTAGLAGLLAAGQSEDADAGFVTKGGRTFLEAFHGSPHKFDKFSMDAIGTGEGAQAYGHGLYFADSEDIAKGYRDALTEARFEVNGKVTDSVYNYDIEEKFADEFNTAVDDYADDWLNSVVDEADSVGFDLDQDMLSDFVRSAKNDFEDDLPVEVAQYAQKVEEATGIPIGDLAEELDLRVRDPLRLGLANMSQIGGPDDMGYVYDQLDEWGPFARDVFDRYIGENIKHIKPEGALYRTEIDVTPESLLDYDMPLQGQPQSIQDAFVNAYRGYANDGTPEGLLMSDLLEGSTPQDALNLFDESKGAQSYRTLAGMVGGEDKASALLNEQGVRGIKFADGNSRRAKQAMIDGKSDGFVGDENYVIFDDSLINIAERGNADPRLLAGTAAGTAGLLAAPALMKDKGNPSSASEAGFPEWSRYEIGPSHGLPTPTWGDIGSSVAHVLGAPMSGLQGLARGGYGLLTGEDFTEAAAQAGNTMDVGWRDGILDTSNMNPDKGADQAASYVTDKTGDESLGWMVKMGLLFGGI